MATRGRAQAALGLQPEAATASDQPTNQQTAAGSSTRAKKRLASRSPSRSTTTKKKKEVSVEVSRRSGRSAAAASSRQSSKKATSTLKPGGEPANPRPAAKSRKPTLSAPSSSEPVIKSLKSSRATVASTRVKPTPLKLKPAAAPNAAMNQLVPPAPHPRPSRRVFVFGEGDMNQLGLGTEVKGPIKRPRLHVEFEGAVADGALGGPGAGVERMAVGGMHSLVVDEAGKVWSWGVSDDAALGRKTVGQVGPEGKEILSSVLESKPMVIQSLVDQGFRAVSVFAGDSVSVAISDQGVLSTWGSFRGDNGHLKPKDRPESDKHTWDPTELPKFKNERFVSAACGTNHVLALTTQGDVYAWGDGEKGQLGRRIVGRRAGNGLDPGRVPVRNIIHVGCGEAHSFAVDRDGVVYAWGMNNRRQTGIANLDGGARTTVVTPTIVRALLPENLGGRRVRMISGGEYHTLFLLDDGSVWGCGGNDSSQLGLDPARQVVSLGNGDIPEPVQIFFPPPPTDLDTDPPLGAHILHTGGQPLLSPIIHISAASLHNLAVSRQGIVYSWGVGVSYQLGRGDIDTQAVPARVKSLAMKDWLCEEAHAGGQHCLLMGAKLAEEEV